MPHAIEIDRLSFTYPDGNKALDEISLNIQSGEKVALIGPNGAGKSTLILQLNGIFRGTGQVRICGQNLNKDSLARIRAMVGMVFQSPEDQLFSPRVFDDVAFGPIYQGLPLEEIERRVANSLYAVGMSDYGHRISHHLSMGEKKRIAIATVLAMDPEVLILDEPTAGLDPRARRSLINLLRDLPLTMFVSTHDMLFADELFPRTVILDEGRMVADGKTSELMKDEQLLAAHGLEWPC
jgi:cobalt/nickel transport system ATP-binding protein